MRSGSGRWWPNSPLCTSDHGPGPLNGPRQSKSRSSDPLCSAVLERMPTSHVCEAFRFHRFAAGQTIRHHGCMALPRPLASRHAGVGVERLIALGRSALLLTEPRSMHRRASRHGPGDLIACAISAATSAAAEALPVMTRNFRSFRLTEWPAKILSAMSRQERTETRHSATMSGLAVPSHEPAGGTSLRYNERAPAGLPPHCSSPTPQQRHIGSSLRLRPDRHHGIGSRYSYSAAARVPSMRAQRPVATATPKTASGPSTCRSSGRACGWPRAVDSRQICNGGFHPAGVAVLRFRPASPQCSILPRVCPRPLATKSHP
jgi:hypothetical protein